MRESIAIRCANPQDAEALVKIYAPYVEKTAITYEYEVPTVENFRKRIENTLQKYPYLVAVREGEILGYAYTGTFIGRAAADWAVETSIYIKENQVKTGAGRMLYQELEDISRAQNILNLNAAIATSEDEDEHLTRNSIQFHEHMGYTLVGEFHKCGYKFGKWYNLTWMEKWLDVHSETTKKVIPFPELSWKF